MPRRCTKPAIVESDTSSYESEYNSPIHDNNDDDDEILEVFTDTSVSNSDFECTPQKKSKVAKKKGTIAKTPPKIARKSTGLTTSVDLETKSNQNATIEINNQTQDDNIVDVDEKYKTPSIKNKTSATPKTPITYKAALAVSNRAKCRKCDKTIVKDTIRVGVIVGRARWGEVIKWQHLECSFFSRISAPQEIEGYNELDEEQKAEIYERFQAQDGLADDDLIAIEPSELLREQWRTPRETPKSLTVPLLPFQKEGFGWMYNQEHTEYFGGILADEMGMGKTIQAISLIVDHPPPKPNLTKTDTPEASILEAWSELEISHERDPKKIQSLRAGTLVICPLIAIIQWRSEIQRFTTPGSLKVLIYHGQKRATEASELLEYDVIITSYSIVEAEFRKMMELNRVPCPNCRKRYLPDKLRLHLMYFCGENAQRTEAQSKRQRKNTMKTFDDSESIISSRLRSKNVDTLRETEFENSYDKVAKKKKISAKKNSDDDDDDDDDDDNNDGDNDDDKVSASIRTLRSKTKKNKDADNDNSDKLKEKRGKKAKNSNKKSKVLSDDDDDDEDVNDESPKVKKSSRTRKQKKAQEIIVIDSSEEEKDDDDDDDNRDFNCSDKKITNKKTNKKSDKTKKTNSKGKKECDDDDTDEIVSKKLKPTKRKRATTKNNSIESELNDDDEDEDATIKMSNVEEALKRCKKKSILHEVSWFRIILDEAHSIKDRASSTAKAVYYLTSLNKWCLTGTPLQNRVGEFYSLVRFLRLDPHAYYFCRTKGCECKSLHYRFNELHRTCEDCGHIRMSHYAYFNRHILNPIMQSGFVGDGRKAMLILKNEVLDKILLRRTKATRAEDILLPCRIVTLRQDRLDEKEDDFYQALYTQSQAQFNTYAQSGTVLHNYAHIFDLLIRLRQAVDHPYLVLFSDTHKRQNRMMITINEEKANESNANEPSLHINENDQSNSNDNSLNDDCGFCSEPPEDAVKSACNHVFCRQCVLDFTQSAIEGTELRCPLCEELLNIDLTNNDNKETESDPEDHKKETYSSNMKKLIGNKRKSLLEQVDLKNFQSSTKVEALMEELHKMEERDPSAKAIVFSQFVKMLDIIEYRLRLQKIQSVKLIGSLQVDARSTALKAFQENPDIKVLLISLKAGGVALNLTIANHIYLMDPWWNPAAEMQAIDRTHRFGQTKPIFATRFIIENTIEERILKLQEKKKLVFDGTVGGDVSSIARLTVDDMRFLFMN